MKRAGDFFASVLWSAVIALAGILLCAAARGATLSKLPLSHAAASLPSLAPPPPPPLPFAELATLPLAEDEFADFDYWAPHAYPVPETLLLANMELLRLGLPPLPVPGDFPVHAGGNIQPAMTSAAAAGLGSTVTIDAATPFTPQILTLPAIAGCTSGQAITIRTANFASLPSGRVSPSDSVNMPQIVRTGADAGGLFFLAPGTNSGCWTLLGLDISTDAVNQDVFPLVNFQDVGSAHLVVDRCYIHSAEGENGRTPPYNSSIGLGGVLTDGSDVTVENSYIDGMWGLPLGAVAGNSMTQSSAILTDVGPCAPCLYLNNYLNAGYSMVQMGGASQNGTIGGTVQASPAPTTTGATLSAAAGLNVGDPVALQVPWDASYCKRGNTFPCWGNGVVLSIAGSAITYTALTGERPDGASTSTAAPAVGGNAIWAGTQLSGVTIQRNWMKFTYAFEYWLRFTSGNNNHDKGYMEIKNGNGSDIEANVFGEYGGWPSVFGMGNEQNQNGDSPFATQSNMTVKNNWLRGFKECSYFGDSVSGRYFGFFNTKSTNVSVTNNLCEQPDTLAIDNQPATGFQFGIGINFLHQHNTVLTGFPTIYSASVMQYDPSPNPAYNGAWTPSVTFKDNLEGWGNYGFGCSSGPIFTCWNAYTELDNLFPLCGNSACTSPANPVADGTFPHSTAVNNWSLIQFVDAPHHNFALQPTSPGYHAASDGTDIGVNMPVLLTATAGVVPGGSTFALCVNSTSPSSGAVVNASPADINGFTSVTTPGCLTYNSGTPVTLTATSPAPGGNTFANWTCTGGTPSGSQCAITVLANSTVTANYVGVTTATVTVQSNNPSSGATINVSPPDNNGHSSCTTPTGCVFTFNVGTPVNLTAGSTAGGNAFSTWTCSGGTATGNVCSLTVNTNTTDIANYAPVATGTLTINSVPTGVVITASPADNNGHTTVTTSGTLVYNTGTPVTLTAPGSVGARAFGNWTCTGGSATGTVCSLTVTGNATLAANYAGLPIPTNLKVSSGFLLLLGPGGE